MWRTRTRRTGHQHLRCPLVAEVAIGEAHAGNRAAEAALVSLFKIEAGLERNALDRGAHGLAADLQGIAGQPHVTGRACARELDRAGGAEVIEDAAGAT